MKRLLLLLAAAAAALAWADYLAWRASQSHLRILASEVGLFDAMPEMEARLRRQTEPARAATLAAWALLDLEVDRSWLAGLPAEERARQARLGVDRLRLARRLALDVLPRRPASWQAAMVLGATRYLEAERTGERDRPASSWRRPLIAAMELAPGHPEPPLFLASASLSRWSSLAPAERQETIPVLTRALEEPAGLELLLRPWARLAPSMSEMLAAIPDRPEAWLKLGRVFREAGDLERFSVAHRRWLDSLPAFAAEKAAQAERRRRGGDPRSADLARRAIALPADRALADSFTRALAVLPDEAAAERATRRELRRWLLWALDLCLVGECPLQAGVIARLAEVLDGLPPAQAALAALVAGDPAAASELEAAAGSEPEWGEYRLHKAWRLAAADPAAAGRALDRLRPGDRRGPLYRRALARLAEAAGDGGSGDQARRELDRLADEAWSATEWSTRGGAHRLALASHRRFRGLRLRLERLPPGGAAVELRWDGTALGAVALAPGEDLVWQLPVEPGLHLLEITSLTDRATRPGALTLVGLPPA